MLLSCSRAGVVQVGSCTKSFGLANYQSHPEHRLPWEDGVAYRIVQPPGGTYSHLPGSEMAHAWDFDVRLNGSIGKEVLASVDGCVRLVKRDATCRFGSESCANNVNHINYVWDSGISGDIYPGQQIESLYLHLDEIYPNVQPGACFKRGDPLGITGCTGWCTGIHLHYQVQFPAGGYWGNSLPVQFYENPPLALESVTSQNNAWVPPPEPTPTPGGTGGDDGDGEIVEEVNVTTGRDFAFQSICDDSVTKPNEPICLKRISGQSQTSRLLLKCAQKDFKVCDFGCEINLPGQPDFCKEGNIAAESEDDFFIPHSSDQINDGSKVDIENPCH